MKNIYTTNEYIKKNPTLHEEDSHWKVEKIVPLIDLFIKDINKKEIKILDVGGGAGLILREISKYIRKKGIKVKKYSLDLSPGMLKTQKKNNLDIIKLLNEDIKKTSLKNKEIDLTLMIDVIEHVPNPKKALKELRRISKYVIFKVPLEDNLFLNLSNFMTFKKIRKGLIENIGHINVYDFVRLKNQIEKNKFKIIKVNYTNVFNYYKNSDYYKNKLNFKDKFINFLGDISFNISRKLTSKIFNDFVVIIAK